MDTIVKEECIICFYDKPIEEYICFPCGHKVCATCYPLMRNICPICRFRDNDILQIEIVIPETELEHIPSYNVAGIIGKMICAILCFAMIYLIVIIPVQRELNRK